eukprot:105139_1
MAYWLGFLFADGCINDKRTTSAIHLCLKCTDYSHIKKYQKALQSTYHVGLYKNGPSCKVSHYISDTILAEDLIALGCTPRKSLTLKWPKDMPDQFASHFARGYLDGDGCIHFSKRKGSFTVSFVGSHAFMESLQIYIKTRVLFNIKARGCLHHLKSYSQLHYDGNAS